VPDAAPFGGFAGKGSEIKGPEHVANVGVAGSRPSFARLAQSARREAARAGEPGLVLQHSRAPSRSCAEGLLVGGDRALLGAAGVPFGVAEIEEAQIRLFFSQCVGVRPLAPSVGVHVSPDDALATCGPTT
jgi:hypothetical protein